MKSEHKRSKDSSERQSLRRKNKKGNQSKRSRISLSKKANKSNESESRFAKNFVTSEPSGSYRRREMKKKSSSSSGTPPPLLGERNILRARVNILEKLANG